MAQVMQSRPRGRPRIDRDDKQAATIQALDRGIQLLRALSKEGKATLSHLAMRVGMPPSSAHRILTTLERNDLVEFREATQEWTIGVETFRIGSSFIRGDKIVEVGVEIMKDLVDQTGETSNLAVKNKDEVVFVSQVETLNPVRALLPTGTRASMHASGIGKAMLAELDRESVQRVLHAKGLPELTRRTITSPEALFDDLDAIRRRGWALDDEECYVGMRCVAAPIFSSLGKAVAGISVSGPTARMQDEVLPELGAKVRQAALDVTEQTGGVRPAGDR